MSKKKVLFLILLLLAVVLGGYFYFKKNSLPQSGPIISFNFDDGFESAHKIAMPMLKEAGIPTTQYIITNYMHMKGYVTKEQILEMEAGGNEIGAHTRNHVALGGMGDALMMREEILGSKQDLLAIGIKDVSTFAYPFGSFDELAKKVVIEAGFKGARITRPLSNDSKSDRFLLRRQKVDADVSFAEVKDSIDQAVQQKKWLILVFHRIDEDGSYESVRHELLKQIIDYVKQKNIPVVTTAQGLKIMDKII